MLIHWVIDTKYPLLIKINILTNHNCWDLKKTFFDQTLIDKKIGMTIYIDLLLGFGFESLYI